MNRKELATALVTAFLTGIVGLVFQYIDPPKLLIEIWQRMFVNIWFVWLAAVAFGLFWLTRFLINLHREMASRILMDNNLSERINNLDRRVIQDIRHIRDNLIAQVDERLKRG